MANKKLFAGITAAVAVLGVLAATGINNSELIFTKAADAEYTLTVTASDIKGLDTVPYVTTALGNQVKVAGSDLTIDTTINLVNGSLYVVDPLNGIKSLTVDVAEESVLPTLHYGWTSGEYAAETITLEDDVAADLTALTPNYFKLEGTANIVSIEATYSCTPGTKPVEKTDKVVYFSAGSSSLWYQAGAWFWAHCFGEGMSDVDLAPVAYMGDFVYKFVVPSETTNINFVRQNPSSKTPGDWDNKWNQTDGVALKDDKNLVTITGWKENNYTLGTYTEVAGKFGVVGSINGWGNDLPLTFTSNNTYEAEITLTATDEIKIREDKSWDSPNYNLGAGSLDSNATTLGFSGSDNIKCVAGTFIIKLYFDGTCSPLVTFIAK